jgi:RNA polymerase sigma-70 factor (ECF subfamily)
MEKVQSGDLDQFGKIYDLYIAKIYNFVYRKTSNKEVAEDIVSDVFMSALNSVTSFKIEENTSVSAWLYRIAQNKTIDFYRKNEKQDTQELTDYLDVAELSDAAQKFDDKEKLKSVLKYIKSLKPEQSEIILLRIWEDLSYKEIATMTGKSIDNCKKIVSRGLKDIATQTFLFILFIIIL